MSPRRVSAPAPATLTLSGELTIQTAGEQQRRMLAALDSADEIGVDLSQVTELDTAGVQLLLLIRREAALLGKRVTLLQPAQPVLDVLTIAGLDAALGGGISTDSAGNS